MTSSPVPRNVLSPGQLAKRWGVSVERVRRLLQSGHLGGAFRIPSAGRYGEAVRIPLAAVLEAEQRWALRAEIKPLRRKGAAMLSGEVLKHFPELSGRPERGDGSRAGDGG